MTTSKLRKSAPGLKLPRRLWRSLSDAGIYAPARVSLEHQQLANRYVIRGVEAGGAVAGLGHYVTYADSDGQRLPYLHPLDSVGVNGVHAVVVAPTLVRVEVFRIGRTHQVLVTKHFRAPAESGQRPSLRTVVIFRGRDGYLNQDPWGRNKTRTGSLLPEFYTPGGEPMEIFAILKPALLAGVGGACCVGCRHSHYLIANGNGVTSPIVLPNVKYSFAARAAEP